MKHAFSTIRWAGSKGWAIPVAERFVREVKPRTIVETYAGSVVVGLTLLDRGYGEKLVLAERDPELRLFFEVALSDPDFERRVRRWTHKMWAQPVAQQYVFGIKSAERMSKSDPGLSVLLRTRLDPDGILREKIRISTRRPPRNWWPVNLATSLKLLYSMRDRIEVLSDALDALRQTDAPDSFAFVDPPYSFGKKAPGHKLYKYSEVDHEELLRTLVAWKGSWLLTSEFCPEICRALRRINPGKPEIQRSLELMTTMSGTKKFELFLTRQSKEFAGALRVNS